MMELEVSKHGAIIPATLVSLVPFEIHEEKPGLIPSSYRIPASDGRPKVLVIGEAVHDVYIDAQRGTLRVKNAPYEVARAIVFDYLIAQIAVSEDAHPALFFVNGKYTTDEVEKQFPVELMKFRNKQMAWFKELVKMADDDWEKTRQHAAISDTQRYAARALNLDRPYLIKDVEKGMKPIETFLCPACGSDLIQGVAVCRYCACVIDKEKHAKLAFAER